MPSTSISASDLEQLVGRRLEGDELRSAMFACKAEIEEIEGDEIKLEIKDSNRIDLLSAEGIARTIKGFLGIETGLPRYKCSPSGITVRVDPSVSSVRPFVVAFVAEGVELTEELIASYMALQEKIHTSYGRGRRRTAIGFYDLDLIQPPISYTVTSPDENAFVPLGEVEKMTPREILERHPKGREFAHLLEGFEKYPILKDASGNVLSMPPIINSDTLGHVTADTQNLFVEATGSEFDTLVLGINVLATALADRGATIKSVLLEYPDGITRKTPDFSVEKRDLDPLHCNKVLGLDLSASEIVDLLRKARFDAISQDEKIEVSIPPYRRDVMHENDLIEDVAIVYGYARIEPVDPQIPTIGRPDPLEEFSDLIRDTMVGFGYQEIMTFILTSPDVVSRSMRNRRIAYVELENPTTTSFSIFRPDLLPSILQFLGRNAHVSYPQRVFEVGDAVMLNGENCETRRKLCFAWADSRVNLTNIKAVVVSLLGLLDVAYSFEPTDEDPVFIPGRGAKVVSAEGTLGWFGEIHPEILENFEIPVPVLAAEFDVVLLMEKRSSGI